MHARGRQLPLLRLGDHLRARPAPLALFLLTEASGEKENIARSKLVFIFVADVKTSGF
jgi:hypothetical protein